MGAGLFQGRILIMLLKARVQYIACCVVAPEMSISKDVGIYFVCVGWLAFG